MFKTVQEVVPMTVRQQVLYWADVMSEIAFVVPSAEMYNRYLADPHGGKCSPDRYRW